jgi:hypothetical protein
MRLSAVALVPSLVAAAALGGCTQATTTSTKGFSGQEKAVAQAVADLSSNGSRKKAAAICANVLAASLRQQITAAGSSCPTEMRKAIDDADDFNLKVDSVQVNGSKATAKVKGTNRGKDVIRTFSFVREAGGWRISDFG